MTGYPYEYGDSLCETDAKLNFEKYVSQYGLVIFMSVLMSSSALAGDNVPSNTNSVDVPAKGIEHSPATRNVPAPSKAGAVTGRASQPPVLHTNLPPTKALTGKVSLATGVVSLVWCTTLAVATRNPALYIAAAALSIYFLD